MLMGEGVVGLRKANEGVREGSESAIVVGVVMMEDDDEVSEWAVGSHGDDDEVSEWAVGSYGDDGRLD